MLNLMELQQLVAFAELESFSKVAKRFYVSTPTITRAMNHVEKAFGATLFHRHNNKVTLNKTGELAVEYARRLLHEAETAVSQVRAFDLSQRTISVVSCAPAPLWGLVPLITQLYPGISTNTGVASLADTLCAFDDGTCDAIVLPYHPKDDEAYVRHLMDEHLFLSIKPNHELAKQESVTFEELNGFNFLLGPNLGFWSDVCREKLTASKFLVQDDDYSLIEIIRQSSLPCFTTDVALRTRTEGRDDERLNIPITDPEANVSFYLVTRNSQKLGKLLGEAGTR